VAIVKVRSEVTAEKLRGGFYTPDALVDFVLTRVRRKGGKRRLRVLEPSAGDGAFIRGMERVGLDCEHVTAVEIVADEAAKARAALTGTSLAGEVVQASALLWVLDREAGEYDITVGNLPFVRFQFISPSDRVAATKVVTTAGLSDSGVSNLWIPMLVAALGRLRIGGRFAFVLPAECFTGVSAGRLREWLLRTHRDLTVDLFPPGSFPGVLQEVVVLSGTRAATAQRVSDLTLIEHPRHHGARTVEDAPAIVVKHRLPPTSVSWTRLLLTDAQLEALDEAQRLTQVTPLNTLAQLEVSTVTGANAFFSVDAATVAEYELEDWLTPLLPRIRHAPGLRYTTKDHETVHAAGLPTNMLCIPADANIDLTSGLQRYLKEGEAEGLPDRFKCRIRDPWYSVPGIKPSPLMLTKRSHHYPRMVLNEASVVTTDTIYRGWAINGSSAAAIVATFHNSLTLLSAELEGRSFGGGVLELVPSEFNRLLIPNVPEMADELARLDAAARAAATQGDSEDLIHETDRLLSKHTAELSDDLVFRLDEARRSLQARRLART
jgi:adenine-specific DNA methylase